MLCPNGPVRLFSSEMSDEAVESLSETAQASVVALSGKAYKLIASQTKTPRRTQTHLLSSAHKQIYSTFPYYAGAEGAHQRRIRSLWKAA